MGFFKDSLKKWFYTQGTQAASESARIPLLDASGNPIGSDTMENVASVLEGLPGGLYHAYMPFNIDTFYNGIVTFNKSESQNITGVCPQTDMRGSLYSQCSLVNGDYFGAQTFVSFSNNSAPIIVYKRNLWSGTWSAWQRCDNFGCNTLSELASLMGVKGLTQNLKDFSASFSESQYFKIVLRNSHIDDMWQAKGVGCANFITQIESGGFGMYRDCFEIKYPLVGGAHGGSVVNVNVFNSVNSSNPKLTDIIFTKLTVDNNPWLGNIYLKFSSQGIIKGYAECFSFGVVDSIEEPIIAQQSIDSKGLTTISF